MPASPSQPADRAAGAHEDDDAEMRALRRLCRLMLAVSLTGLAAFALQAGPWWQAGWEPVAAVVMIFAVGAGYRYARGDAWAAGVVAVAHGAAGLVAGAQAYSQMPDVEALAQALLAVALFLAALSTHLLRDPLTTTDG